MTARKNVILTIQRNHPSWVPYRYDDCITMITPDIVVRPPEGGRDDWNVNWIASNTEEGSYPDGLPAVILEEAELLDAPFTDWTRIRENLDAQIKELRSKDTLIIVKDELALFERAQLLLGFADFMLGLKFDTEMLAVLLDKITDYQQKLLETIMDCRPDGVRFTDDWGMQDRLFISPEDWRTHFKPRYQKLYDIVKKKNGFVFQHSCGCIDAIMQDIASMGVDVLDPCQPSANDIFMWKKQYGDKLCFMGGLDTQTYLTFGTPDEVKTKVEETLAVMSQGGGYIAAPSHTITIPLENRQAMMDAIFKWNNK